MLSKTRVMGQTPSEFVAVSIVCKKWNLQLTLDLWDPREDIR